LAFRDYEELVEDIIYNLVNGIDVEAANSAVEKYRAENLKIILENQSKAAAEDKITIDLIRDEVEAKMTKSRQQSVRYSRRAIL
jgi:hypothetical protein